MSMKALELKAEGRDIISLSVGEPDFDTPAHICQAAIEAIKAGKTRYTAVDGTPQLKDAIIAKLSRDNELVYESSEILVSGGAKQSIYNMLQACLDAGDEVLIPAPYWVSYPDMVRLADAEPVILHTSAKDNYLISPQQLSSAINEKTRLLILNAPSNPTGMGYSQSQLKALGEVLLDHPKLLICSDDIYEHIWWGDEPFRNIAQVVPELKERMVLVNGVSKAYAMTGWRIGYAAGPAALISQMRKIQGQSTSNPCSISQAAAVAALNGDQQCVADMARAFKERHDWIVPALNDCSGLSCQPAQGAFYVFADCHGAIESMGLNDDFELAEHLLEHAGVATVPGTAFGAPNHLRFSFALGLETLKEAVGRVSKAISG
jgi:aspartate aminotransferase